MLSPRRCSGRRSIDRSSPSRGSPIWTPPGTGRRALYIGTIKSTATAASATSPRRSVMLGRMAPVLAARHAVYQDARQRNPRRWSGLTRNWKPVGAVALNPERGIIIPAATSQVRLSGSIGELLSRSLIADHLASPFSLFGLECHFLRPGLSSQMRRVEQRSRLAEGHRWRRRVAVLRAASTARPSNRLGSPLSLPGHGSFRGLLAAATWHLKRTGTSMSRTRSSRKSRRGKREVARPRPGWDVSRLIRRISYYYFP